MVNTQQKKKFKVMTDSKHKLKDLFNGDIVGYAMGESITKTLVSESLFRAVLRKRLAKGLIHHSDQGRQYCSYDNGRFFLQFGMKASIYIFFIERG